jgi:RNA polymerase sigma-70 factor (ECF subfamily)
VSNAGVPPSAIPLACADRTVQTLGSEAAAQRELFADAVQRHEPAVRRLVHRLLGWPASPNDVDDIVQDVMLLAWRHRDRFRGEAQWSTWLARIGINTTRNHQRRWRLLRRLFPRDAARGREPVAARCGHAVDAPVDSPNEAGHHLDAQCAAVRAALGRLKHADREILVLRYLEQLPIVAIADALGISRNAFDVRLSRARARLRRLLAEAGDA